ncbi:MAG: MlaE family lipid ABC transporter permease subunit [Candidatus Binatia bacterium]|nr:MlaE family lipid ABC transporter permease subunit [Candidatus Binatia bacterium]
MQVETVSAAPVSIEKRDGVIRMRIAQRMDMACAPSLLAAARNAVERFNGLVELDLSQVPYFDSAGGAVVLALRHELRARGGDLKIVASTPAINGLLGLIDEGAIFAEPPREPPKSFAVKVGEGALKVLADAYELISFTGELVLGLSEAVRHPRKVRWRETWLYMERTGVDGVPIVVLISFLMGLITAFQAAIQLTQFGADIFVANLVGLSITRELGPLMTAIIAAGRSGAAFAAEIGTMKVSDEVDALTTMGLDRTRFLVTPKVVALVLMLPCLTIVADLVGILGGLVVAVGGMDLPAQVYFRQLRTAVTAWDVISGLIKTVAFAVLIAGIGCLRGFQASTGAESVGRITTSAIVAAIFLIIFADAVFTVIFHYW